MGRRAGMAGVRDTALWAAHFRAEETRRTDALFRDPYAIRLASDPEGRIPDRMGVEEKSEWSWAMRTYLFDGFIYRVLEEGADMIVNLAAGLDARPYRMDLQPELQWIEVDFAEVIGYKEAILANDEARCRVERIALDLSAIAERRKLFADLNKRAKRIAVLSEGMLIYFAADEVAALSRDLADAAHIQNWIVDLASTIQMIVMQQTVGARLSETSTGFQFGPPEGVNFFKPYGWEATETQGILKRAAEMARAPAHFLALLPEPQPIPPEYPWTGVCLLKRA